ncbi:hypothetical protein PC116_g22187 [Phytophthora cactorum]|uniref:Uncharacterized protein n=1 Tax=Phytophthora cactorum TaxID=29920 RepID=A0A8T1JWM6_9STRA|nr:hypothetical protein PC111_g18324 [Phytophthora cactorum]KAG2805530.1 hypothetical protein PC112_g18233 [Phytophthora cactorum]KAG2845491.1 hypothetical protein PC113_g18188 [Phytophthora cactorum]KAG2885243.1 hypothetical protein PC114_g19776 [Phytophthora cactorum]KAG2968685.1 hypothetical protein PC118_g17869 [Phytophthora cactorum]
MEGIGAADGFKKGVSRASDSKDRPFTLMGGPRLPAAPLRSDLATQSLNFAKSVELQVSDTVQFQIHLERSNWSQRVGCREWQQQNTTART